MDDSGQFEILLVLSCLVGVIVFLCFALGAVNLAERAEGNEAMVQPIELAGRIATAESEVSSLRGELDSHRRQLERERAASGGRGGQQDEAERETGALAQRAQQLKDLIRQREAERTVGRRRAEEMASRDSEYAALRRSLDDVDRQLRERNSTLASIPIPVDEGLEQDLKRLQEHRDALDKHLDEARQKGVREQCRPDRFSLRACLTEGVALKRPLIIECRRTSLVMHPGGKEVPAKESEIAGALKAVVGQHDGIVFLIRPDGFDAFKDGYNAAAAAGVKVVFEPLAASASIEL